MPPRSKAWTSGLCSIGPGGPRTLRRRRCCSRLLGPRPDGVTWLAFTPAAPPKPPRACFGTSPVRWPVLAIERVVQACCPFPGDELDIERLLLENGTLYLLGKGSRLGAVAPLITALADEVFDRAERLATRMPSRRLDPPLLGLLDEAPSIAPVPTLPELLADGRGRGIVIVYAMQSFSQAVTRWGAQRAQTMGNATTITAVLGGLTSPSDLSDLERVCGQRRVRRESTHRGSSGANNRDHSRTTSWESETVLRADQIRTLGAGVALVLWSKLPPFLARLPLLSEMTGWREVQEEEKKVREANDRARSLPTVAADSWTPWVPAPAARRDVP